jgi:hypothetical protein
VFPLVGETDHAAYDALDVSHWDFWVVPRAGLRALNQQSLNLATVQRIAGNAVSYHQLAGAVQAAAAAETTSSAS